MMLTQAACTPMQARPAVGQPDPGIGLVRPDSTRLAAPDEDDPNHCPGRRVARVGIMTVAGAGVGWAVASVLTRFGGPGDDRYSRGFRRKFILGSGAIGTVLGTRDAIRERCEDLPFMSRETRGERSRRRFPPRPMLEPAVIP